MNVAMPPGTDTGDRPSDFGASEFWREGAVPAQLESIPPASRAPVAVLSPEQRERRRKLQRLVSYVVGGAVLFTLAAGLVHFASRSRAPAPSADSAPTAAPSVVPALAAASSAPSTAPSQATSGLANALAASSASSSRDWREFVKAPSADPEALDAWSSAVSGLNGNDVGEALGQLTRMTTAGKRTQREAAGLGLAILWRVRSHPVEAHKMLTRLARHAGDRGVRDYASKILAQG